MLNEDSSFSLHQSHPYQQAEDVLFSVAQVIFNMQAQADSVGIQIHGEVSSTDSVIELLRSYYPRTRPMSRIKSLQYPEELFQHPSYYFLIYLLWYHANYRRSIRRQKDRTACSNAPHQTDNGYS
ncbi:MAG: hypothetical protein HWD58_22155 [Bacteroidota bacterium]|nr:MAG: hypothetical protein HWD58_22155 [Bacteroidota bacterium]